MPRVKIDYIVSFSSEDPEHPASNLLAWEVSKKKWLCKKGESSCSVVLQLTKAVKISAVQIGAYHSSLVEVLVARSETASDQFQVLVPSGVFVSPLEARRDAPVERVRQFSAEQLAADCRLQAWDRVRVVCSQPYNRHCKFGLSFIHIDSPEAPPPTPQPAPPLAPQARMFSLEGLSEEEEDFRPGELFSQHLQRSSDSQGTLSDTGAQIRQATSQALKNIPESSTKLVKAAIGKAPSKREAPTTAPSVDRSRDSLLYTDDDRKPHAKIDHVVERHRQVQKDDSSKAAERRMDAQGEDKRTPKRRPGSPPTATDATDSKRARNEGGGRRGERTPAGDDSDQEGAQSSQPHSLLRGVVLVLSGYVNPERAQLRNTALALGARVERDWGPRCTHLVCAFPNTPKARQARSEGGSAVPVVRGAWLAAVAARRRRLPWRWYATDPKEARQRPDTPPSTTAPTHHSTDGDTDDEIEKVLQKDRKATQPTTAPEVEGPPTDEESEAGSPVARFGGALAQFFEGYTFALGEVGEGADAGRVARYIVAYGGLVLQMSELEEDSAVDFLVGAGAERGGAKRVSAAWVARCHEQGALLSPR